jgi:hypothetical protein
MLFGKMMNIKKSDNTSSFLESRVSGVLLISFAMDAATQFYTLWQQAAQVSELIWKGGRTDYWQKTLLHRTNIIRNTKTKQPTLDESFWWWLTRHFGSLK